MSVNFSKLEEAGWTIISRKRDDKVLFLFVDPKGCKFRSAIIGTDGRFCDKRQDLRVLSTFLL